MTMLSEYITHAEKYGTDWVYETAEQEGLDELDSLALHLQRLDDKWELTRAQSDRLIDKLLDRGFTAQRTADMAGVSLRTVKNRMVERKKSADSEGSSPAPEGLPGCTFEDVQLFWAKFERASYPASHGTWREWVYGGKRTPQPGRRR